MAESACLVKLIQANNMCCSSLDQSVSGENNIINLLVSLPSPLSSARGGRGRDAV